MVKKKVLKAQIDLLTNKVAEQMQAIETLEEKVDFLFRQSAIKAKEENDSLFDEWMNGAREEGEK